MVAYKKTQDFIFRLNQEVFYNIYKFNNHKNSKLLLLPGSRLGGIETWESLIPHLYHWSEIIIIELRGAGTLNPINKINDKFTVEDLLEDVESILQKNNWEQFDLVGYSFGGYLSMLLKQKFQNVISNHILIESALLAEVDENLNKLANELEHISNLVISDPKTANHLFTKLVNPQSRQFQLKPSDYRAIYNSCGFANLMMLLCDAYRNGSRWDLIKNQGKISSLITEHAPSGAHQMAERINKNCPSWRFKNVPGESHSMVFIKPTLAATLINDIHYDMTNSNK